jgi:hypothetical protein
MTVRGVALLLNVTDFLVRVHPHQKKIKIWKSGEVGELAVTMAPCFAVMAFLDLAGKVIGGTCVAEGLQEFDTSVLGGPPLMRGLIFQKRKIILTLISHNRPTTS